jgi:two-component system sensor histidine kinase DesK
MTNPPLALTNRESFSIDPIVNTGAAKWSYFSLVFSVFYFFNLIVNFESYTNKQLMVTLVIYVSFFMLFFKATRLTGKAVIWPIVAIIVLSAAGASINPGTNALFGYAAFLSGYYFLRKYAVMLLIVNLFAQVTSALTLDLLSPYYLGPSLACSFSFFVYGIFSQKEHIHVCLQLKKNQQIEQLAAIAERERIARDMHDLLGHSLSSLALKSELAEKLVNRQQFDAAKKEISEVADLARQTLSEVRYAVTGLKQHGLKGALDKLANELKHMEFKTQLYIDVNNLPPMIESTLIMLSKEWITNILRHSNGNSVSISVTTESNNIKLNIGDNGKTTNMKPGNGIEGMRSRVTELRGTLDINHDHGVKLAAVIPFSPVAEMKEEIMPS